MSETKVTRWPKLTFPRFLHRAHHLCDVYDHVLGTTLEIQVVARTRMAAERARQAAFQELQHLTRVANRFDPDSEFRRWLSRPGERQVVSADLMSLLRLADHWQTVTAGAFHPAADALGELWKAAAHAARLPDPQQLKIVVRELRDPVWTLHDDHTATPHVTRPVGLNAFAKGFIVDRMAQAAARCPDVTSVLVNAGGDLRTIGKPGTAVQIADPSSTRDDVAPVGTVQVTNEALATSGAAHRGYSVNGRWYSHVLDPRPGPPVQHIQGVSVLAADCATADALATIANVLHSEETLALVEATPGCAAVIFERDGAIRTSRRWPGHVKPAGTLGHGVPTRESAPRR